MKVLLIWSPDFWRAETFARERGLAHGQWKYFSRAWELHGYRPANALMTSLWTWQDQNRSRNGPHQRRLRLDVHRTREAKGIEWVQGEELDEFIAVLVQLQQGGER